KGSAEEPAGRKGSCRADRGVTRAVGAAWVWKTLTVVPLRASEAILTSDEERRAPPDPDADRAAPSSTAGTNQRMGPGSLQDCGSSSVWMKTFTGPRLGAFFESSRTIG